MKLTILLTLAATAAFAADTPDFGLMLNNDGDLSLTEREPAASEQALRKRVQAMKGTPIKTLMYCVGGLRDQSWQARQWNEFRSTVAHWRGGDSGRRFLPRSR